METIKLTNGNILEVATHVGKGMAGESMEYVILTLGNRIVRLNEIKQLLTPKDLRELKAYLDEINESNHDSAVSFVI